MKTNELTRMPQPVNKGILCSESVKAKMNGSYVASLDRFSPKNGERLPVETSELYPGCSIKYFLTKTHFNELSLVVRNTILNKILYLPLILLFHAPGWSQDNNIVSDSKKSRIAFVLGINEYEECEDLKNAVRDAKLMKTTLEKLGFEVIFHTDLTKNDLQRKLDNFMEKAQQYPINLFYFAGHGIESDGKNYIFPADVHVDETIEECAKSSVDVQQIIQRFDINNQSLSIVILDACRNNPYKRKMRSGRVSRGFKLLNNEQPKNLFLAFSTSASSGAQDGDHENSVYTKILCEELLKDQGIQQVFEVNYERVCRKTKNSQRPEWRCQSAENIQLARHLYEADVDKELISGPLQYRTSLKKDQKGRITFGISAVGVMAKEIRTTPEIVLSEIPENSGLFQLGQTALSNENKVQFDKKATGDLIHLGEATFMKTGTASAVPMSLHKMINPGLDVSPGYLLASGILVQVRNSFRLTNVSLSNLSDTKIVYGTGIEVGFLKKWGISLGTYTLWGQKTHGIDASILIPWKNNHLEIKAMYEYRTTLVQSYPYHDNPKGISLGIIF